MNEIFTFLPPKPHEQLPAASISLRQVNVTLLDMSEGPTAHAKDHPFVQHPSLNDSLPPKPVTTTRNPNHPIYGAAEDTGGGGVVGTVGGTVVRVEAGSIWPGSWGSKVYA